MTNWLKKEGSRYHVRNLQGYYSYTEIHNNNKYLISTPGNPESSLPGFDGLWTVVSFMYGYAYNLGRIDLHFNAMAIE